MSRRLAATLVALVLLAAGCSGSSGGKVATPVSSVPTTAPPTTAPPGTTATTAAPVPKLSLQWAPCSDGFECTTGHPPLDYDHPEDGRTADLAIIRSRASGPPDQRLGVLFFNPGGPGAAATSWLRSLRASLPQSLASRFDFVAFDPRGSGGSDPVVCEDGPTLDRFFALDPSPDTPAERQALIDGYKRFGADCKQRNGDRLAHVDTKTAARDWDLVRDALGEDKISYLGFSYGTLLGAVYADLFPKRVRAFVLDGALDPTIGTQDLARQQAVGFENALQGFFADCRTRPACAFYSGGNPAGAFDALAARIEQTPLPTKSGRTVGPGEFWFGVAYPLYQRSQWSDMASALNQAATTGTGDQLLSMSDRYTRRSPSGTYDPLLSANSAVNCIDRPAPTDVASYDHDAPVFAAEAPHFGALAAYGALVCAYWPYPPVDQPHPVKAAGSAPILVVGTTGDPATPYSWSESVARQLEHAVLLTRVGDGHTAFFSGNTCARSAITAYVVDLTLPPPNTKC